MSEMTEKFLLTCNNNYCLIAFFYILYYHETILSNEIFQQFHENITLFDCFNYSSIKKVQKI